MNVLRMNSMKPVHLCHTLGTATGLIKQPKRDFVVEVLGSAVSFRTAQLILNSTAKKIEKIQAQKEALYSKDPVTKILAIRDHIWEETRKGNVNTDMHIPEPKTFDRSIGRTFMGGSLLAVVAGGVGLHFAKEAIKDALQKARSDDRTQR